MMEVYAGFLEHTDYHIGRLLDFLKEIGEFDNTLIMIISDNGASSEGGPEDSVNENLFFNFVPEDLEENLAAIDEPGGPKHFNHYPWGWTWPGPSFTEAGQGFGMPISAEKLTGLDANAWELYHVAEDFAENHNIAAEHRDKLIDMIAQWYVEAGKYNVLPVDGAISPSLFGTIIVGITIALVGAAINAVLLYLLTRRLGNKINRL